MEPPDGTDQQLYTCFHQKTSVLTNLMAAIGQLQSSQRWHLHFASREEVEPVQQVQDADVAGDQRARERWPLEVLHRCPESAQRLVLPGPRHQSSQTATKHDLVQVKGLNDDQYSKASSGTLRPHYDSQNAPPVRPPAWRPTLRPAQRHRV